MAGRGVFKDLKRAFRSQLEHNDVLDWDEAFADGSLAPAKKGERESAKPSGEGTEMDGGGWSGYAAWRLGRPCLAG